MTAPTGDLAGLEPLVPDLRIEPLRDGLRLIFPRLASLDLEIATAIQPGWTDDEGREYAELAVFLVVTGHPKRPGQQIVSHASTRVSMFREAEEERRRFAGRPDPLRQIFYSLARQHNDRVSSLAELID